MKSWNECRDEVMAELELASDYNFNPKKVFDVYIYKGEKIVEVVSDIEKCQFQHHTKVFEALRKHDTEIYEAVCINELEVERAKYSREAIQWRTFDAWHTALREEFSEVNENVFDVCYAKAYDDYHGNGYDSVADGMCEVIYFAKQIIEANCRGFNND